MLKSNWNLLLAAAFGLAGATLSFGQEPTPLLTQPEDKLIAVLKSDAPQKEKADACRELAVIGTKSAVPALAALLGDNNLSHMARYGLETIPDPSVDAALRAALGKLKGRLLAGVIGSLGVRRDAQAVKPLAGFLSDADADVSHASALALGRIGTAAAVKALEGSLANAPAANQLSLCEGLLRCAEAFSAHGQAKSAAAIYDRLRHQPGMPHQVRAAALRGAILARGKDGWPLLRQALRESDYLLFAAALRTSQEMPGSEVTKLLADELSRASANQATFLAGRITPESAAAKLAERSPDRQIMLAEALGQRRNPAGLPVLLAVAQPGGKKGNDTAVRVAAIRALPEIGDASAAAGLADLAVDANREVAQAAQEGLAALPGPAVDTVVLAMLDSSDTDRRLAAIEVIGRRRMASAVPALLQAAGDPDAKVRPAALKRLGELAGPKDQPALLATLLKAQDAADLDAAEQALSAVCIRAGNPEASAAQLTSALATARPAQKGALLRVLSAVGGETARQAVRTAVTDANPEIHAAAIRALGDWRTADAGPELLALAQSVSNPADKSLCLRGALRLAADADQPAGERLALCRQAAGLAQQPDEKKLLLGALGGIKTAQSLALVAPYLDDASVKEEAGAAVVAIAGALLQAGDASLKPGLVDPLQKAAQLTGNADLARRAGDLLRQAQGSGR